MLIKFMLNDKGSPAGKLADAELHFGDGALQGMKLLGFGVWERRNGPGRNVTFPARPYGAAGDKRNFTLLRAVGDTGPQERLRETILAAFVEYEARTTVAR